jgi:hypothetical protein
MLSSRRTLAALVAIGALTVFAACGGDDSVDSSGSSTTASTESGSSSSTTPTTEPCTFNGSDAEKTGAAAGGTLFLTALRSAGHECYDRVVFEFRQDGTPGYTVGYQPGPILQDASGEPVAVAGSAYLVVRVTPATGYDFDAGVPSYNGPNRVTPGDTAHVQEVVRSGDFEAIMTWVIGLDEVRPFTVSTLTGATRLVIDIG